jgi:hypothetical protein
MGVFAFMQEMRPTLRAVSPPARSWPSGPDLPGGSILMTSALPER